MVIVDGNNVIGQRVGWHRNKSAAQQRLIDEVEGLARFREEPHILVFDAGSRYTVPDSWNRSLLKVRCARGDSSADELILELVYRQIQDSEVLVVTSDGALTRQVRTLGAKVMRSGAFRKMLEPDHGTSPGLTNGL
jgi:predicted RNA-binding protein with PIN domain